MVITEAIRKLIADLEDATEGSRDLDARIAIESGWIFMAAWVLKAEYWMAPDEIEHSEPPQYTTSLDAADALGPEGWDIAQLWQAVEPKDRPWWGISLRRDEPYSVLTVHGAKTKALARCIPALKAMLAELETQTSKVRSGRATSPGAFRRLKSGFPPRV